MLASALALSLAACSTSQEDTNPSAVEASDSGSSSAATPPTSTCCDAGIKDGSSGRPPTLDASLDDASLDDANPELPPSEDPGNTWLSVYGPDVTTGRFRTWLVDPQGTRVELTPFSGTHPIIFDDEGELALVHQAATADEIELSFHRISGSDILPPVARTFPRNAMTSRGWGYASAVQVLESEAHVFEDGVTASVLNSELTVFDGIDPTGMLITSGLPPFELPRFALPIWSPETSELFYPEATNDDLENPTWQIQVVRIAGRDVSAPETVIENAIWPIWSPDGRWLQMTVTESPWALSSYTTQRQKWLLERGTWQRFDLGLELPGEEIAWRFTSNTKWLVGEQRNENGSTEVLYRRVPDGEPLSIVAAEPGGSVTIRGHHSALSRTVIEERDAANVHLRSYYVDFEADPPEIVVVEGAHTMNWPGAGDLVVIYVADEPAAAPGPETTGTVRLYRTLPKPENLLAEVRLNYWLIASAADQHFVFHTEDGWFSISAEQSAEPVALDLGDELPQMTDARVHPTQPFAAILGPDSQNYVRLLAWPDGQPHVELVEFPELEWLTAYWVQPPEAPLVPLD